ncbi:MAG TPA: hypothetical protein VER55_09105, partial [Ardenticatenaceae bacterium]|nr:hypothetical protein [Ardenticatenaceae bacterium]
MAGKLNQVRIGFLERRHPPGHRGALVDQLVPLLREQGARLDVVHSEEGLHRLNERPAWDVVVLKSGSAAALHLAAAAESWGIPCVNSSEATRLAQDKLANAAILQQAGLPIAPGRMVWLDPDGSHSTVRAALDALAGRKLIVKAARGSRGAGLWVAEPGELPDLAARIPAGPYLLMDYVAHSGDDLKVFVAGPWQAAIERPFPARSYEDKLGRPVEARG